jgi:hypothetical protein
LLCSSPASPRAGRSWPKQDYGGAVALALTLAIALLSRGGDLLSCGHQRCAVAMGPRGGASSPPSPSARGARGGRSCRTRSLRLERRPRGHDPADGRLSLSVMSSFSYPRLRAWPLFSARMRRSAPRSATTSRRSWRRSGGTIAPAAGRPASAAAASTATPPSGT